MKFIAILPAYNAQDSLIKYLNSLPWDLFSGVILIDDASTDRAYELALSYQKKHQRKNFFIYQNSHNLGYGGNLIRCLSLALEKNTDAVIELHPDGEYGLDGIAPAIKAIQNGANLVLGNRFANGKPEGMYWSKYLISHALTTVHNFYFCKFSPCRPTSLRPTRSNHCKFSPCRIPDLHQGFRIYSRHLLNQIPFHQFSFDYLFSWQIILAAVKLGLNIKSVPVTAHYQGEKRGASWWASIKYAFQSLLSIRAPTKFVEKLHSSSLSLRSHEASGEVGEAIPPAFVCPLCHQNYFLIPKLNSHCDPPKPLAKWEKQSLSKKVNNYQIYFCSYCQVAFTHPHPGDMSIYYGKNYWQPPGLLGSLKKQIFRLAQKRRLNWIIKNLPPGSHILDVGAGEGIFADELSQRGYQITSIDTPFAHLHNPKVLKIDFLTWVTPRKFDAIVFWESFEHVSQPLEYLVKVKQLLKPGGILFIEYPRFDSWEAKVFDKFWFNLDIPRHLFHFTGSGLRHLLSHQGFTALEEKGIWSAEYAPWGFVYSLISYISHKPLAEKFRYGLTWQIFYLLPLFILSTFIEFLLYLLGQSPIGLIIAKKP